MERLTKYHNGVCVYIGPDCKYPDTGEIAAEIDYQNVRAILKRLAAYEDTGLTPEEIIKALKTLDLFVEATKGIPLNRIREFVQAEKDGRVIVLPCKAGDLLYEVDLPKYGVITCKVTSIYYLNGPQLNVPGNDVVSALSVQVVVVEGHGEGSSYDFEIEDFGKTVFLTREEAEAALKGGAE